MRTPAKGDRPGAPTRVWMACAVTAALLLALAPGIRAETNQATGDIAGDAAALVDSNVVTINSTGNQLAVVKRAFKADGTVIPSGSSLPRGSLFYFLIYINNDSPIQVRDVSLQDVLDPVFAYQNGTMRTDNSLGDCVLTTCDAAEELAIFNTTKGAALLNDSVDADEASYTGVSRRIDIGNEVLANAPVHLAASSVWALVFEVRAP